MSDLSRFHPDEGVDRKQLKQLKQRFLQLNATRLERTRAAISIRQQLFLDVLPLLLHTNHPMLPGYNGAETPAGIAYFKPNTLELSAAKMIARSFELKKDYHQRELNIDAVFLMGSVGTIAHSERSDFDVWVCHKSGIDSKRLRQLEQKCEGISQWAERELNLEAHCFLVCGEGDRNDHRNSLNAESSGSAQQHLLLDEFYRSAIWLAGKTPLWWLVPAHEEPHYDSFTSQLLHKRFVRRQDIVDFGPITHIPMEEYLGAGIWQLYKGINAPHKSVLKLMLLESYALEENPRPLALDFKELVQTQGADPDRQDSYLLIYRRIERYLEQRQALERLELARRCLYFKVAKPLTRPPGGRGKSWQRRLLEELVKMWGWDNSYLLRLDAHTLWKANQVIGERERLIRELSKSYRLLGGLSHRSFQDASISSEELSILGRKLHAAFEKKSGKIERINPGISSDVSEAFLTIRAPDDQRQSWQLLRCRRTQAGIATSDQLLRQSAFLFDLLLWSIFNSVLEPHSQLDMIMTGEPAESEKRQLIAKTRQWLPDPAEAPGHEDFLQPARVNRVLLVINLALKPYEDLDQQGLQLLSEQSDALSYSGLHDNLIQLADMAYMNTWHELIVRHLQKNALVELLLGYLRFAPPHLIDTPPELSIVCPDQQFGSLIEGRLTELFDNICQCFYGEQSNANARYLIETHRQYYILQFQQGSPQMTRLEDEAALMNYLETPQRLDRPLVLDSRALPNSALRTIIEYASGQSNHLFYEHLNGEVIYTYVDVSGAIVQLRAQHLSASAFPASIVHFIEAVNARLSSQGEAFALGHYNTLTGSTTLKVSKLVKSAKDYLAEPHQQLPEPRFFDQTDIKVIAEPDVSFAIRYTLYCDEKMYHPDDGDPFAAAARYIHSQRASREHYHCHISDLDLTACADVIAPETGLQLIHYLQEKRRIEDRLNQQLRALT